jgi:hypothetical protein
MHACACFFPNEFHLLFLFAIRSFHTLIFYIGLLMLLESLGAQQNPRQRSTTALSSAWTLKI